MMHITFDSLFHWRKLLPSMRMHHALTLSVASYNYFVSEAKAPAMVLLANETSTVFYCAVKLLPPGARFVESARSSSERPSL